MTRRVVVTGAGVVTGLGNDLGTFWQNVCASKSGVTNIRRFDCSEFKVRFGGEVQHFDPTECIPAREVKRIDRFVQFAVYAATKAIRQSGMDFTQGDPYRYGVVTDPFGHTWAFATHISDPTPEEVARGAQAAFAPAGGSP